MIPFHQGKAYTAASAEQGRGREGLPQKWFQQLLGRVSQTTCLGAVAPLSLPGMLSWRRLRFGENPQEPDIARAQPHTGTKNLPKVGSGVCRLKANIEARLVEGKFALIWRSMTGLGCWGGRTPVQRPTSPSDKQRTAFVGWEKGLHAETDLKGVTGGLISAILIAFSTVSL